ncbi:MAG: aminotransferase class V-fold PLP-dependent enzyme [Acidimicrobiia bacterium]|nr:aminotransferase class V-fold PLP-dependent enzyme [Acidimicrobiia bacterium]
MCAMFRWTRRNFLWQAGLAPIAGGFGSRALAAAANDRSTAKITRRTRGRIYEDLGLRPFINAAGTYTTLSACIMPSEVVAAMEEAARRHVSIPELQEAAGKRIASLVASEAALVTSGCAEALTLATAACVCGSDAEKIRRVPDTTAMKNEVIFQKSHRFGYDHAIRNVGVQVVEIETMEELDRAITSRTAMLFFLNSADHLGRIKRQEFAEIARKKGIPSLIDAAADVPPAENLTAFLKMGYDMAAFSGGKGIRGPQCSGLLLGRKDLIEAAFLNGSPHADTVGRGGKVGKEEIVGLMTAVELFLKQDHQRVWKEWENQVRSIGKAVAGIQGVESEQFVPAIANAVPHLAIKWDPAIVGLTRDEVARALREGEPRIEVRPSAGNEPRLEIAVWMLQPGEYLTVGRRCAQVLRAAVRKA